MFRIFAVFLCISGCINVHATKSGVDGAYGLKFHSNNYEIQSRTSLELIEQNEYTFRDKLELSFDLNIHNFQYYGYICRLIDGDEISLQLVPFLSPDTIYFDLVHNRKEKIFHLAVSESYLKENYWHKIKLCFDPGSDSITMVFDDVIQSAQFDIKNKYSPTIAFGLYSSNLDVAAVSIKDLILTKDRSKILLHYPFHEFQGNYAFDVFSGRPLSIKNPDWLAKDHYFWDHIIDIQSNVSADYSFNPDDNLLYITGTDSLIIYDISSGSIYSKKYRSSFPLIPDQYNSEYNRQRKKLDFYVLDNRAYIMKKERVASLDPATMEWENIRLSARYPRYWHHNTLYVNGIRYPVVFGGYGQFMYFNHFLTYDEPSETWKELEFTGDQIPPRFFSSISQEVNGFYYMFGGYGNPEKKQELGGFNYYDLYEIDTENRVIRKVWELPEQDSGFVGGTRMVYLKDSDSFFSLCYGHHIPETNLRLYKFNASEPRFSIVSDGIPITSEKIITEVSLFYSEYSRRFIAAIRENRGGDSSIFRIYSLLYPPLDDRIIEITQSGVSETVGVKWALALLGMVLLVGLVVFFLFRFRKPVPYKGEVHEWTADHLNQFLPEKNAIFFFGTFKVSDHNGKDISHLFSPMLRKLFALMLNHQLKMNSGITSTRISQVLWPDKEVNESKNIRGVTTNHLRSAIETLNGIEILHENNCWLIKSSDDVFIDLKYYVEFIRDFNDLNREEIFESVGFKTFLAILSRGKMLPSLQEEWLDAYISEIEVSISELLLDYIEYCRSKNRIGPGLTAANILLSFTPFNEDALERKIDFLIKMGNPDGAKSTFNNFVRNYEKTFGESSKLYYNQITGKNRG